MDLRHDAPQRGEMHAARRGVGSAPRLMGQCMHAFMGRCANGAGHAEADYLPSALESLNGVRNVRKALRTDKMKGVKLGRELKTITNPNSNPNAH